MFPDLKIAFCISGEPRQYKNCYKNLLDYIEDFKIKLMNNWGPNSKLSKEGKKLFVIGKHSVGDVEHKKIKNFKSTMSDPKDFKVTVDIFIHSWNSVSTHRNYQIASNKMAWDPKQHITYDIDELRDDLIEKYNPKRILVESKDVMDDLHEYYVENGLVKIGGDVNHWKEEPPYVNVNDLKDSNYLALM